MEDPTAVIVDFQEPPQETAPEPIAAASLRPKASPRLKAPRPEGAPRLGKPKLDPELCRVQVSVRMLPATVAGLKAMGEPNIGRAIDKLVTMAVDAKIISSLAA